jgi:hypothetical protein
MKEKIVVMGLALAVSGAARASVWNEGYAAGNGCRAGTVTASVEEGERLFLAFDALNLTLPAGLRGDGLTARRACAVRLTVTVPDDQRLVGFRQTVGGRTFKSESSSGRLSVRASVGADSVEVASRILEEGTAIEAGDTAAEIAESSERSLTTYECGGTSTYGLNLNLLATRASFDDTIALGIAEVVVEPVLVACQP